MLISQIGHYKQHWSSEVLFVEKINQQLIIKAQTSRPRLLNENKHGKGDYGVN